MLIMRCALGAVPGYAYASYAIPNPVDAGAAYENC